MNKIEISQGLEEGQGAILGELEYFGRRRDEIMGGLDKKFDRGWDIRWYVPGKLIEQREAIRHYEDAYFNFLSENENVLNWLTSTASEVYDIDPGNVDSGLDYGIQESTATHLQDISVRRVLKRLGREFVGDHLVQIRGRDSEGYVLNPGKIPFHMPEIILPQSRREVWWDEKSTEAFYQQNKALVFELDNLVLTEEVESPDGTYFSFNKSTYYLQDAEDVRILHKKKGRDVRRKTHEDKENHRVITDGRSSTYSSLI